ncbi:MAG: FkbM family methyltransferase [Flavobacteriales bacterium]
MRLYKAIPPVLRAFYTYRKEESNYGRIRELNISGNGISDDGIPYITTAGGKTFFGYPPSKTQVAIFRHCLPADIKKNLQVQTVNVAYEVARKYLPPRNEREAQAKNRFAQVSKGTVLLEGGAYVGYYAMRAAELVGQSGKVIAVEAIEENFRILKRNMEANGIENVILLNMAIWNEKKRLTLYRSKKQIASISREISEGGEAHSVDANTIDSILEQQGISKVDYLRLQINGAEYTALQGMDNTLKQMPEMLIASPYSLHGIAQGEKIKDYLRSKGFATAFTISKSIHAYRP